MTAVAYAHPTLSRFAIAEGMLRIGGLPIGLLGEPPGATALASRVPSSTTSWRSSRPAFTTELLV